jgi:hypothetical protein
MRTGAVNRHGFSIIVLLLGLSQQFCVPLAAQQTLASDTSRVSAAATTVSNQQEGPPFGMYAVQASGAYVHLFENGSFVLISASGTTSPGHFTIQGNTLTLTYTATGRSGVFRLDGDKVYINARLAWVRESNTQSAPTGISPTPGNSVGPISNQATDALLESTERNAATGGQSPQQETFQAAQIGGNSFVSSAKGDVYVIFANHLYRSLGSAADDWDEVTQGEIKAIAVDPQNEKMLYAFDGQNHIVKSLDAGKSWLTINTGMSNLTLLTIMVNPANSQEVFVGTTSGLIKTADAGFTDPAHNLRDNLRLISV